MSLETIRRQLLENPNNKSAWDELQRSLSSSPNKESPQEARATAAQKSAQIQPILDLICEDQAELAIEGLRGLVTANAITIEEWQLLLIAVSLHEGQIEKAENISRELIASEQKDSAIIQACKGLFEEVNGGGIATGAIRNIIGDVFNLIGNESHHSANQKAKSSIHPSEASQISVAASASQQPSVQERKGWQAILDCTQNDPEARFLLEYYLSVLDGVAAIPRPELCSDNPLVSIVIPVYNMWPLLQNCLKSIAKAANSISYEVIVGDDCSDDETDELMRLNPWVQHARMETNGRFIRNCNNAAKLAKGKYIYFLNNDTVVLDHWLDRIIETFERRPDAGVVGSQVLFHTYEVQESGGIIWPDGEAWNYGRNIERQKLFQVNYSREVDYVSGCALTVRRDIWEQSGGFGEEFVPAYCEDSDLCYKTRDLGYSVWVQPSSKIIHFEGLSNSKDLEKGLKTYQKINMKRLIEKWKVPILKRGIGDTNIIIHASNHRLRTHRTCLIVDHYVPQPDKDAGSRTVQAFCEALINLGYNVIFLPENHTDHQPYTSNLEAMGVCVLYGSHAANHLEEVLRDQIGHVDCILYNRPHITKRYIDVLTKIFPQAKSIYYMHDLHGLREYLEKCHEESPWDENVDFSDAEICTPDEQRIIESVDLALTCSSKEADLLSEMFDNIRIICPYDITPKKVKTISTTTASSHKSDKELLFVGGFGHTPNRIGIEWFADKVIPLLDQSTRVHVVGSRCPDDLRQRLESDPKVVFHGFASDEQLDELLERISVSLAPLPFGAGIKGKVVEALAAGHTVIGTKYGIEGMEDVPEGIYKSCHTPEQFAEAIEQVLSRTRVETRRMAKLATHYVANKFNLDRIKEVFSEHIGPARRDPPLQLSMLANTKEGLLQACSLLPSSFGLEHDGWLLRKNRLVFSLAANSRSLKIDFFLPDDGSVAYPGEMELSINVFYSNEGHLFYIQPIEIGCGSIDIRFPSGIDLDFTVIEITPMYRFESNNGSDGRQLAMLTTCITAS